MWKNPKLIDKWLSTLPGDVRQAVSATARLAEERGIPLYLVGGPLRDLLLDRTSLDIDFLVEGNAVALAQDAAATLGGRPRIHPAFGTATIQSDHWHIDFATARRESYPHPGALPQVIPATVQDDLQRRDFTVNAMALRVGGDTTGELLDPFGGEGDLRAGLIRALHEGSFRDDATRILRAARYAARLGFQIESATLAWIRRDKANLQAIGGARLHREFSHIFREAEPECALALLQETGVLADVHPGIAFPSEREAAVIWLREVHPNGLAAACWPLLASGATSGQASALASRLALTKAQTGAVEAMPGLRDLEGRLASPSLRRSELVEVLACYPLPAVWALAAVGGLIVRERCVDYLVHARHLRPVLRGGDVIALGVLSGRNVGEVLRRLRVAKLDGAVKTRRDEERFVRGLLAGAPSR